MRRGYALVRKQPLKIFCSLAIKTKSNRGPYRSIKKIDTHRSVHAKGDIEAFIGKRVAHFFVRLAAFGFVEDDKLNIRYVGQELRFGLADDPGDFGFRPVVLNTPDHSKRVTCVTDRGEANDTYFDRLRF